MRVRTMPTEGVPRGTPIVLHLPFPLSVNATRRVDWRHAKQSRLWIQRADQLVMTQKPLRTAPAAFELAVVLSEAHGDLDTDNGLKILIDYLRRIEIIVNDSKRYFRRLVVEWGDAPHGCKVTVIPYVSRQTPSG